jgi:nitroreductase
VDTVSPQTLVERLEWRYAVKKFDATRKIPADVWTALERSLVLTPSSFGLQPWKFLVIESAKIREQLVAASWNQRQVVDASHVVVFAIRKNLGAADVERYVRRIVDVRGVPAASLDGYRKMMLGFVEQPRDHFDVDDWSARQVYIALGSFMTAAALLGVDACPMEGIVPVQYDGLLGLAPQGLATVVVCCAGYRAADDRTASAAKVRFPHDEVVVRV